MATERDLAAAPQARARRLPSAGVLYWLAAVALGVWLRVAGLGALPLYGDEYHTLGTLEMSYGEVLALFDPVGSHVALPLIQKASADLFGPGIVANRLVALVPGLLALVLLYPLGRPLVGGPAALLATAALAVSPMHVFYSRFARGYALSLLLALLLVEAVRRASDVGERASSGPLSQEGGHGVGHPTGQRAGTRAAWIGVAVCAGLLPYVHLTSLGLVGAVFAVAAWLGWRRRGARGLVAPVAAFGAGGLLAAVLFLPARATLLDYLGKIQGEAFTEALAPLALPTLLAGGRAAGAVLLVGAPLAAVALARRSPERAALCLAPVVGPLLSTIAFQPNGMAYAYARYLHVGLPFLLLLVAWLACGWLVAARSRAQHLALALGTLGVAAAFLAGPRSPLAPDNGPYDNTYLSMHRLPAFDAPFVETPEFYRRLAEDDSVTRIVEAPPMGSRSVLLFRNYYLQHGKQTLFGLLTPSNETLVSGPYVRVFDKLLDRTSGAQYLIVHKDLTNETARYWSWVYNFVWSRDRSPADAGFMVRHIRYLNPPGTIDPKMLRPVTRRFGAPVFEDEHVWVIDLRTRRVPIEQDLARMEADEEEDEQP